MEKQRKDGLLYADGYCNRQQQWYLEKEGRKLGIYVVPMPVIIEGNIYYDGKVHVVDNHRISVTQRHSVQDTLMLADRGFRRKRSKRCWNARPMSPSFMWGWKLLNT